jgi:RNA polymerase sigma-70 factor (ECF subfamily)
MLPADADFTAGIREGDDDTIAAFDSHFRTRLELMARQRGLPYDDARDVAQEVLVAAVDQIRNGRFRGDSKLSTWVIAILHRRAADYFRAQARLPATLRLGNESSGEGLARSLAAHTVDPVRAVLVRQLLGQLSPIHRAVLVLRIRGGFTHREIAAMLRKTEGTIWRLASEAQSELARLAAAGPEGSASQDRLSLQ